MTHSDFIQMNLFSGSQDTEGIRLSCVLDIPLPCDEDPRSPITVTWYSDRPYYRSHTNLLRLLCSLKRLL